MLFTVPFACCCTVPLWKKGTHFSQSLTAGTSKLQDRKPAGTAKLFPSSEKDLSSEKEIKKKKNQKQKFTLFLTSHLM